MENQAPKVRLLQHRHCQVCGRAIKVKEEMCSDKCKKEWDATVRRKRMWLMAYGLSAAILVLIMVFAWR
jgi:predicted nucleic acid-binding Zn ribbon protein